MIDTDILPIEKIFYQLSKISTINRVYLISRYIFFVPKLCSILSVILVFYILFCYNIFNNGTYGEDVMKKEEIDCYWE